MRTVKSIIRERPFLDLLPHFTAYIWGKGRSVPTTLIGRAQLKWWRIESGVRVCFNGLSLFRRHPRSSIIIGTDVTFSSHAAYNTIGINRRCILSTLSETARIEVGDGCGFSGTVIGAESSIRLGRNVRCGANTLITDTDWHTDDYRTSPPKPVVIEDNVWLGVNVTVMKGVTIGENSLIGANSLVTRDIPPNVIAAGSPAVVIRELPVAAEPK
jgi:acetyltransferase-like isoleucine patch superfamily enzyme